MSWWVAIECDGHRNGQRCLASLRVRTGDVVEVRALFPQWRLLSDVLSPETHAVLPDDHLCPFTPHDEERPGYGYTRDPGDN